MDFDISYRDVGIEVYIGNQWQLESFSLGVDWLGLFYPLYVASIDFGKEVEAKEENDLISLLKGEAALMDYRALRFYLGVSF